MKSHNNRDINNNCFGKHTPTPKIDEIEKWVYYGARTKNPSMVTVQKQDTVTNSMHRCFTVKAHNVKRQPVR